MAEPRREQPDAEDQNVAKEVESGAQPLLNSDDHVVGPVPYVKTVLRLLDESALYSGSV